jgi:uncharacterized protein (DUF488 family)
MPELFTIGFTKKSAADFFEKLRAAGVKRVIDVRLNNSSQLAGFSKRDDLRYFLEKLLGIQYVEEPLLAPTPKLFDAYKKKGGDWDVFQRGFLDLMAERKIEEKVDASLIAGGCLLCSEEKPHHCHRRLVAEYLHKRRGDFKINHIV